MFYDLTSLELSTQFFPTFLVPLSASYIHFFQMT